MVHSVTDFHTKLNRLASYATQGKWNTVLDFATHYRTAAALAAHRQQQRQHDAELVFTTYKVLALMRLRRYSLAGDELARLGDFPAQQLLGGDSSEPVPFGLLYLRAQLPACLDQPQVTLDLLYQLRDYCQLQQQQQPTWHHTMQNGVLPVVQHHRQPDEQEEKTVSDLGKHDQNKTADTHVDSLLHNTRLHAVAGPAEDADAWQQRLHTVTCSLILHHWQQNDIVTTFKLLDRQLQQQPDSIQLWSLAGRLQLQLQLNQQAQHSFNKVQQLVQQQQQQRDASAAAAAEVGELQRMHNPQQLMHHNWGCYHALNNNMTAALQEFHTAQQICTSATTAATAAASEAADAGSSGIATDPLAPPAAALEDDGILPATAAAVTDTDGVSVSNTAVCLLHQGQLTEAISTLEAGLMQDPDQLLHECTLFNLGMMYDLAYPPIMAQQTRHQLAGSVRRFAADDLDLACIEQGC